MPRSALRETNAEDFDRLARDRDYCSRQLVTYLGSKRALLGPIGEAVARVQRRLGRQRLRILDLFSGSGVVSRFLKVFASSLVSNDLEDFAAAVGRCYLQNRSEVDWNRLETIVAELNDRVDRLSLPVGFIEELYAPRDEAKIGPTDRVFYTRANARRLDNYRRLMDGYPRRFHDLLLGPLLSAASIHANTAGVFKGFYKNRTTGVGQFGGSGRDALARIRGEIRLQVPVLSCFECDWEVHQEDANALVRHLKNLDLAYLDPPYNQHPYGSNYFMLNLLTHYRRPTDISRVAGIPSDWNRSGYNVRARSLPLLEDLLDYLDAPFILISFNNEGFIDASQMCALLKRLGRVTIFESRYNAFRGSRNFARRSIHVLERLFLLERRG